MKRALLLILLLLTTLPVAASRRRSVVPPVQQPGCAVRGLAAMLRSTDGGATWGANEAPSPTNVFVRGLAALDASTVLVATLDTLHESNDGGCSYHQVVSLPRLDLPPTITPAGTARAYVWSRASLFRWDRGSVTPLVAPTSSMIALGADNANPDHVRIADGYGTMWESSDGGGTWFALVQQQSGILYDVAFDPSDFDHVARSILAGAFRGIQISHDSGATWAASNVDAAVVYDLAFSAVDPAVVWATSHLFADESDALLVSTDGGRTFRTAAPGGVAHDNGILAPSPRDAARVTYMEPNGLRTFDLRTGAVRPLAAVPGGSVERFAISPASDDVIYVARSGHIFN
jgi:photosystem II stability/assembly factor-like uncharacterized protein